MSFARSISILGDVDAEVRRQRNQLAFRIDRRVIQETPVDTGEARINWVVSVGSPDSTHLDFGGDAARAIAQGQATIEGAATYTDLYIQNNAPHIERLNEGWSEQAPSGYVDAIIEQEVRR